MKTFMIAMRLIRKRRGSLLLLGIEIILVAMVFFSILSEMVFVKNTSQIVEILQGTHTWYFTPFEYYDPDFCLSDYLQDEDKEYIEEGNACDVIVDSFDYGNLTGLCYSDMIINELQITMQSGIWFTDLNETEDNRIPVVTARNRFKIGEEIELTCGKTLYVIGTISNQEYLLFFMNSANSGNASLGNIMEGIGDIELILPYDSEEHSCLSEEDFLFFYEENSQMLSIDETSDVEKITDTIRNYGALSSISEMKDNYIAQLREFYITEGMILLVFSVLTVVGMIGINGIQSVENERTYTICFMLGMDRRKSMLIEAINTFFVVGVSYLAFIIIYQFYYKALLTEIESTLEAGIFMGLFVYLLLVYAITSSTFIFKAGKQNVVELYRRGN